MCSRQGLTRWYPFLSDNAASFVKIGRKALDPPSELGRREDSAQGQGSESPDRNERHFPLHHIPARDWENTNTWIKHTDQTHGSNTWLIPEPAGLGAAGRAPASTTGQPWPGGRARPGLVRNFPPKHFPVRRCHFTKGETFAEMR